jgi:predicted double-glycine peptidase
MPLTRRILPGLALLLAAPPALAQDAAMRRPQSWQQRRYAHVVRQVLEFSCGSASLATLLTHFLGRPTTEFEVITLLRRRYPAEADWRTKQEHGFSFEDITFAAEQLGFAAQPARIEVTQLPRIAGPVIVHLDKGEWQHFSVLRASRAGFHYLADPIQGQVTMLDHEFRREFTGAVLAVWRRGAGLPTASPLQAVRDGVSVERTVSRAIQAAIPNNSIPIPF